MSKLNLWDLKLIERVFRERISEMDNSFPVKNSYEEVLNKIEKSIEEYKRR